MTTDLAWAVPISMIGLVSFSVTYATMPWLIKSLTQAGITGIDFHKPGAPKIATMGGIGVFAGLAAAITVSAILPLNYRFLFAIFLSATLAVLVGLLDDLFRLGKTTLVWLTFLFGAPVIAFQAGSTIVYMSPVGPADLGWVFWILVPFAYAFLMNGVNIYAGFNGLEASLGAITAMSLSISAILYGSIESALSLLALSGALLAFLRWNWFPAKIFMGGSGTFLIGAVLASSIISGTIKLAGVVALTPYFINFVLRALDRFTWSVGETTPNGEVVSKKRNALWALFMYKIPTTEPYVVRRCLLVQLMFGLGAIVFAYYHVNFALPR